MSASPAFQETHAKPFWPPLAAGIALGLVLLLTFVLTGHGLGATGASTRLAAWLGLEVAPAATESNAYLGPMVEGGARSVMASWISWQVVGVAIGAFVAALLGGRFRIQFDGSHSVGTPRRAFAALLGGLLAGFGARVAAGCTSGLGLSGAAVLGIAAFVFLGAFFAVGLISYRVFRGSEMFPLNDSGMVSGLICGALFGFVLENAGFGSPRKLTAQFSLTDWSVFKVMFTAIVVAAFGLWGLRAAGLIPADALYVPTSLVVASAIGGALVGAGFATGGYCPGTSVVGFFSGRLDALLFIVGLLLGTFVFAGLYGPTIQALMAAGEVQTGDTFTDAWGIPQIAVLLILLVALIAVFIVGGRMERRARGPVTAAQAVAGAGSES